MKKIVVIGSCNTDMVIKANRLPVPGETVLGGTFLMNPGGKGANQAVAVARLGGQSIFISKTGNDIFGRQSVELYNSEGINTEHMSSDSKHPSGVALITVDSNGENCIVVASGANAHLTPADIEKAKDVIISSDILLMQLEIPLETVEYATNIAVKNGVKVILNPAPAQFLPSSIMNNIYMITPNEVEAEILSGIKVTDLASAKAAAIAISNKGVKNVVITLGAKGAFIKENDLFHHVSAYTVDAVDTTAAGDTFNGAVCVALAEGKTLKEAVDFASKASAITVTQVGAQSSIPYRKELDLKMEK